MLLSAGIGLLSMPYAMCLSGWMGLAALALASALFCTSGWLIVLGFERVSPGPKSFARLGEVSCVQLCTKSLQGAT